MNDDNGPADPMTDLATGMAAVHEAFKSLTEGGFTEQQALYIVAQVLLGKAQ
jgi:hypothetical protein